MLNTNFKNLNTSDFSLTKKKLENIRKLPVPAFELYKEDIETLSNKLKKYSKYDNLIVIGNGGSNTSFKAYHNALVPLDYKKKVFILTTMEPDLLAEVKKIFPKNKTLVMPISKSGTTIGLLEAMFYFSEYKMLPVTSQNEGALSIIAKKSGFEIIPHPPVGGRFSGLSSSAYAPALFFGIDAKKIDNGARAMYARCRPSVDIQKNPALKLAASLYLLEKKGYTEIFCPIYSSMLTGFENLIVQLMHESVCKNNSGQTVYCADAPESQHHTNQRFFGGKRNVIGLFLTVKNQKDYKSKVSVPSSIKDITIRGGKIGDIDGVQYSSALNYEFLGTYQDAVNNKIPCVHIEIDSISAYSVGQLLGFWHYVAVYSALLRGADPFDQPHVESSKDISFRLRKEHAKIQTK